MTKRRIVFLYAFSIFIVGICVVILNSKKHIQSNAGIIGLFILIIVISIVQLISSIKKESYSFNMMYWLFSLFFFGVAPLLQYFTKIYSWNLKPTDDEIITTNVMIIIWLACYMFSYRFSKSSKIKNNAYYNFQISSGRLNILLFFSILITAYYLIFVGMSNLMIRGNNQNAALDQMMSLLVSQGFHNFVLATLVLFIIKAQKEKKIDLRMYIIGLCFLISCFPTGLSRNMMASFYAGLLIILLQESKANKWITVALVFGLILVFPAINIFRNESSLTAGNVMERIMTGIQSGYLTADYDAHQMFISIQRAAKDTGISYGRQFLGAILFFVPRSIWTDKPVGTGRTAFETTRQFWYSNVSAPLISEMWVNFGIVAVIIGGFLLGNIVKKIDSKYWNTHDNMTYIRVIYPFSMMMFFFVQRGDLQSTWAYTFAQIIVFYFVYKFAVRKTYVGGKL